MLRKKQLGRGSRQEQRRPEKVPVTWERRLGFPSKRRSDEMRRVPQRWEGAGHTQNKATTTTLVRPEQGRGRGSGATEPGTADVRKASGHKAII